MRKNFLVLMLLSLLPLAGWAENYSGYTVTLSSTSATYSAANQLPTVTLVSGETVVQPGAETFTYAWTYDGQTVTTAVNQGVYTVTVTATGESTSPTNATATFTITKADITVTAPSVNDATNYTGGDLQAIATTGTFSAPGNGTLTVKYAVTSSSTAPTADAEGIWYTSISDNNLKKSEVGTYYAYYQVTSSDGDNVNAIVPTSFGTFTINPIPATISHAPTAKTLTYNGAQQDLVNAGTASGGTMQYSLDGTDWSANIPQAKDYSAEGYKVYYKVAGDANHSDYQPMTEGETPTALYIAVTIAKKNLKVKPVAISTFFGGLVKNVNNITLTYDGFVGSDAETGEHSVFDNNTYKAPVAAFASNITATTMSGTDYVNVVDNANGLLATNPAGATASALNYNIILQKNSLVVKKSKVKLTLIKAPETATYGTTAASKTSWTFAWDDNLTWLKVEAQTPNATTGDAEYTTASSTAAEGWAKTIYDNLDKYLTKLDNGTNVNPRYTIKGMSISRANTSTDADSYELTLNTNSNTATSNTQIESATVGNDASNNPYKFTISAATITITPENPWKVYGDPEPTSWEVSAVKTGTDVAYTLNSHQKTAIANAISRAQGETVGDYLITIAESVKQNDAFKNITVTLEQGWFTIEKAPLTITANAQTLYVGNTAEKLGKEENTNYTVTGLKTINGTKDNATVDLVFGTTDTEGVETQVPVSAEQATLGQLTTAGPYQYGIKVVLSNIDDLDDNYDITLKNGALTVVDATAAVQLNFNADNTEAISAANNHTVAVTFSTKTLKAGYWYPMVLPFAVKTADLVASLKALDEGSTNEYHSVYAVVNRFSNASTASHIQFVLEMKEIPANEPFMIKTAEDVDLKDAQFGNKLIKYSATPIITDADGSNAGNEFVGVYAATSIQATSDKTFVPAWYDSENSASDENGPRWRVPGSAAQEVKALEAYLVYSPEKYATSGAPLITFEDLNEDGTTSIITVNANRQNVVTTDGWYTINGVKMQGAPTQKGIYINNGKKIIVK